MSSATTTSPLTTICKNTILAIEAGTGYLDAIQDAAAPFRANQVRIAARLGDLGDLSVMVAPSLVLVPGDEDVIVRDSGSLVLDSEGSQEILFAMDLHFAVTSYGPADDGHEAILELHQDVYDAIHWLPIATGYDLFPMTRAIYAGLRFYKRTSAATAIWVARYVAPFARKANR